VLATWDATTGSFEHFAWGLTPELGDRVGRAQADLEERQHDRATFIDRAVAARAFTVTAFDGLVRDYLATEPPRVPAPVRPPARPSPLSGGLTDPEPHQH
jgi:hypothetical protein